MSVPKIVTRSNFSPYVEVAANLIDNKLFPRILEAQNFDICELMGSTFYYDFLSNFNDDGTIKSDASQGYKDLYAGSTYEYKDNTYQQDGIIPVIVYFSSARLIRSLDLHITPNGVMAKRNEYSDHMDMKAIGAKATEYENIGIAYWNKCRKFIDDSGKTVFPKYAGFTCCDTSGSGYRNRVYGIQGEYLNTMGKTTIGRGFYGGR